MLMMGEKDCIVFKSNVSGTVTLYRYNTDSSSYLSDVTMDLGGNTWTPQFMVSHPSGALAFYKGLTGSSYIKASDLTTMWLEYNSPYSGYETDNYNSFSNTYALGDSGSLMIIMTMANTYYQRYIRLAVCFYDNVMFSRLNLANPITKTNQQTMKVVYEITW